jgi:hypothetical protein
LKKLDPGQIVTILANIGVIAGIVFLGFELEQNNNLLRAQASYNLLQDRIFYREAGMNDPEVAEFWVRAKSGNPLSAVDEQRLRFFAEILIVQWQNEHGQYAEGNLAEDELPVNGWRAYIHGEEFGHAPIFNDVWGSMRPRLRSDFVQFFEENVANP